ncbi:hypothetical protein AJ80_09582 [Polytolypa hystricis UAMH7299]|uniref:Uncharacterized protein n=1 Tax=Polytolypa hystricis (strain UAMH7299) TaxID=1447883 RepID=A0A2B7WNL0_POLH7|nr:hypothetical protein AJ80_09582 [Polytolypa hystricis UAMH7299]
MKYKTIPTENALEPVRTPKTMSLDIGRTPQAGPSRSKPSPANTTSSRHSHCNGHSLSQYRAITNQETLLTLTKEEERAFFVFRKLGLHPGPSGKEFEEAKAGYYETDFQREMFYFGLLDGPHQRHLRDGVFRRNDNQLRATPRPEHSKDTNKGKQSCRSKQSYLPPEQNQDSSYLISSNSVSVLIRDLILTTILNQLEPQSPPKERKRKLRMPGFSRASKGQRKAEFLDKQ